MATNRISIDSSGNEGNNNSLYPSISADGRYIAFESSANNLITNDINDGTKDIFVRDLQTNTTRLISLNSNSIQSNNTSLDPSISADGRYVAFQSAASNLITDDSNATSDIFIRDLQTNATRRVNLSFNGTQANNFSQSPTISADGRFVVFYSEASNLVSGDSNDEPDIFIRDLQTNTTQRVSVDSNGNQSNGGSFTPISISTDGRYVAFESDASNLVTDDTNDIRDIFVRDLQTNTTSRVSLDSNGIQGNSGSFDPSISADGRYVAFESDADNLVPNDNNNGIGGDINDIFVRDLQTNTTILVSVTSDGIQGDSNSFTPSISADGRYVAFVSTASNFVIDDTNQAGDVFVRDLQANTTRRISLDSNGNQGSDGSSVDPSISADGRYVAFNSFASNLVVDDTNESRDIFVTDVGQTSSPESKNLDIDGSGGQPTFARDGLLISAYLFYYQPERTDYSVLDQFIFDPNATLKTGNEIASYLKDLMGVSATTIYSDEKTIANANSGDILGTLGDNILVGNFGNNRIFGDTGDDLLTGGTGKDSFVLGVNSGLDSIIDLTVGEDLIQIDSSLGFENRQLLSNLHPMSNIEALFVDTDN